MFKSKLFRNFLSLSLLQVVSVAVPLIQTPYLVRVLGPAHYGRIGFAMACVSYVGLLAEYGFNLTATKRVSIAMTDGTQNVGDIFWGVMYAKVALALVGLVGLAVAVTFSQKLHENLTLLMLFYLSMLGQLLFPQWYFQGIEKMPVITIINISAKVTVLPLTILFVRHEDQGVLYAAIYSVVYFASGVAGLGWAMLTVRRVHRPRLTTMWRELQDGFAIFLSMLAVNIYTATNTVVLGFVAGDAAVGLFVGADKIIRAALGLVGPVHNALYPRISATAVSARADAQKMLRKVLKYEGLVTLAGSAVMIVGAKYIVLGFLGPRFTGSVLLLQIMAILFFVIAMSNVFGSLTLLPFGKEKVYTRIIVASSLLHIAVISVLAPMFGAVGAAVAVVFTESVVTLGMGFVILSEKLLVHSPVTVTP